jgi:hypothetical protein
LRGAVNFLAAAAAVRQHFDGTNDLINPDVPGVSRRDS